MTTPIPHTVRIDGRDHVVTLYADADGEIVGRTLPDLTDDRLTTLLSYYCLG